MINTDDKKVNKLIERLIEYTDSLTRKENTEIDSLYIAENAKALAMLLIAKAFNDKKL